MNSRIVTTLTYLQSILDIGDDEALISIKRDQIHLSYMSNVLKVDVVMTRDEVNPIRKILEHITEYMCTDCLKLDYLYKDDFFINLVKGYIETLVHEFGTRIPITRTLAQSIMKYDLCEYAVGAAPANGLTGFIVTDKEDNVFKEDSTSNFFIII
jgi:hypothetical protein